MKSKKVNNIAKTIPNIKSLIDNSLKNFEFVLCPIINIIPGNNIRTLTKCLSKIKNVFKISNYI